MNQSVHLRLNPDPTGQALLDLPWPSFHQMVVRSKTHIANRSPTELIHACQLLDWMFFKIAEEDPPSRKPQGDSGKPACDEHSLPLLGKHLHEHIGMFNIQDISYLPNLSWAELFSVMTLALLQDAADAYTGRAHLGEAAIGPYLKTAPAFDQPFGAYGLDCLLGATEALTYADIHAQEQPVAKSLAQQAISINAHKAAIARHADTNRLKDDFYDYCKSKGFGNVQQAAREFIASHTARIEELELSPDNVPRMLAEHVYARRNSENPPSST